MKNEQTMNSNEGYKTMKTTMKRWWKKQQRTNTLWTNDEYEKQLKNNSENKNKMKQRWNDDEPVQNRTKYGQTEMAITKNIENNKIGNNDNAMMK